MTARMVFRISLRKASLYVLLCALACWISRSACAETRLTVAAYEGLDEAVKIAIPLYEASHPDVTIKLVSLANHDHHLAMTKALVEGGKDGDLPDVMGVGFSHVGAFGLSGTLEKLLLPPYQAGLFRKQFHRAVASIPGEEDQRFVQASIYPRTLVYRQDLLSKAGVDESALSGSWEAFIEAGKRIKAETGACLIPDAADIADLHARSQAREQEGIYWENPTRACPKPNVDSPRFRKAFELALAARQAGIDCGFVSRSIDWLEGIKQSKIAGLLVSAQEVPALAPVMSSSGKGLWRVAQLPGHSFVGAGGDFYAIPAKSQHKAEAWDFIRFLTMDAEVQAEWAHKTGAFPALIEAQTPDLIEQPLSFLGGQPAHKVWEYSLRYVKNHPVEKYESTGDEVIRQELHHVFDGTKTIQKALQDATGQLRPRCRR